MKKKILLVLCLCLFFPALANAKRHSCKVCPECCTKKTRKCGRYMKDKKMKGYKEKMEGCQKLWGKQKDCFDECHKDMKDEDERRREMKEKKMERRKKLKERKMKRMKKMNE